MTENDDDKTRKGHCPECGPKKMADVVKHFHHVEESDEAPVWLTTDYRILRCRGCSTVYFQSTEVFSEDDHHHWYHPVTGEEMYTQIEHIKHWPPAHKRKRVIDLDALRVLDEDLCNLYVESCQAFDVGLNLLAAAGIRSTIDRGANLCGIDPALTFEEKLDGLQSNGKIGLEEKETLFIVIEAGSAATHRGWRPSDDDLHNLFFALEIFLQRLKFPRGSLEQLKKIIPPKPKRQKRPKNP